MQALGTVHACLGHTQAHIDCAHVISKLWKEEGAVLPPPSEASWTHGAYNWGGSEDANKRKPPQLQVCPACLQACLSPPRPAASTWGSLLCECSKDDMRLWRGSRNLTSLRQVAGLQACNWAGGCSVVGSSSNCLGEVRWSYSPPQLCLTSLRQAGASSIAGLSSSCMAGQGEAAGSPPQLHLAHAGSWMASMQLRVLPVCCMFGALK